MRSTKTTIHLRMPRWYDRLALPPAFVVAVLVFIVAGAISAVGRYTSRPAPSVAPTPALAYIILKATPAPVVPTVAPPTPDTRVLEELAALREQVAQLQAAQQAQAAAPAVEPQVVYVASEPEAQAAPTVDAAQYQIDNQPPAPTQAPQVRAEDFKTPDPKAACAFVGCLR